MKKTRAFSRFYYVVFLSVSLSLLHFNSLRAQIYEPDGVRMPGTWNEWVNEQGMGGDFDLLMNKAGKLRWQTSFQFSGTTGVQEFKFVSTSFGDVWGNQWAANANVALNQLVSFTYGTPSDPNNSVNLSHGKWYSVVFEDNGYADSRAIFMETSASPTLISEVSQQPVIVGTGENVTITANLAANPTAEEQFFLRYSTNDWETSTLVNLVGSGNTFSGQIPAFPSQTEVQYYVFSSTVADPSAEPDLLTLRVNNNNNQNYSYIVDQQFDCGQGAALVTSEPAFPLDNTAVTIYFNAAFGNGGLFDFEGDVYAHTGVITNLSSGNTDWKYVKTAWGENTPETKLSRISENLYSLEIPHPREYYGVPAAENILKLAFVFRSELENEQGNYQEHKTPMVPIFSWMCMSCG